MTKTTFQSAPKTSLTSTAGRKRALITGASAGIGQELAREFAQRGIDLVLVARRSAALEALSNELTAKNNVSVVIIAKDLQLPGAAKEIYDELTRQNINIDYLVNNAGVGIYGDFLDSAQQTISGMLQLNMIALTELTRFYAEDMSKRGSGGILNVASTAAFQPGPHMAGYYASKAYVLSLSEALAYELKPHGVVVSALCPGPTASEFQQTAKMEGARMLKNSGLMMTAAEVAAIGFKGFMAGRGIIIPGLANRIGAYSVRFAPRSWVTWLSAFAAARDANKPS